MKTTPNMNAREKELYMYVAEDATYATGNQAIFKASDFMGAASTASTTTIFRFRPQNTVYTASADLVPAAFELTHTADAGIEVLKTVADIMAKPHGGFVVVQDDLGTAYSATGATMGAAMTDLRYPAIASTGTAVAVTEVALTGI